ncbi:phage major capsid protein [Sphingomonas echinoides]|uniref:Phage major capsid protein n=1 Tax=Sphingomonas echinoides TaxID=59803 RepID=A0ABU4PRU8_9SPHN|nr:phage major capsid protein [Sphingomonas echinoides]MDX5984690.1 phage major capsid protein [Sphingomonas echinoides]
MINIKALRDQRAAKATEARNLLDTNTTTYTAAIGVQVDAIYEEIDRIDEQIVRAERQAKIDGDAAADEGNQERQQQALNVLSPDERAKAVAYNAAFRNFLVRGERGLTNDEITLLVAGRPQNAQSGQQSNGAAGGYLVPTGWGGELLEALKAFGGMRSVATVVQTAGGNSLPWPTVDETGQEGELVAENQPASAQDASFGTIDIGAFKFSSKIFTIPFELLQDQGPGIDIEAFIRRAAATRIARVQNRYYTVGTGTNQPRGIVTAAVAGKVGVAGQTATVLTDDLVDLEHSVDPAYRAMPGVGWMFHDNTLRVLKKMKDSQNRPLWMPGYTTKEPDTFNGYKYTINQQMPTMAANAKSILFGDMSQYMIRDVMAVTLFRFDDSTYTSRGQVGFLAWARGDGDLMSAGQPVAYYQNSAS